eukprot:TRINITY_DN26537_c0_g1_i1.p1 TRINITY_DN26537_c0_g1~~TRINITY_DN26537_c0_g1_i1.p1  ORF type:complete len:103 (-),score=11.13 TRINITY_DN26537_c0_g1_i1:157-465(-)
MQFHRSSSATPLALRQQITILLLKTIPLPLVVDIIQFGTMMGNNEENNKKETERERKGERGAICKPALIVTKPFVNCDQEYLNERKRGSTQDPIAAIKCPMR